MNSILGLDNDFCLTNSITTMKTPLSRVTLSVFAVLVSFWTQTATAGAASSEDLFTAVSENSVLEVARLLEGGMNPDERDGQRLTPLMRATRANQVEICRLLLFAGADANLEDPEGVAVWKMANIEGDYDEYLETNYLVRCYAYLQEHANAPEMEVSRPNLVLINEPTIDYNHPALKPHYFRFPTQTWIQQLLGEKKEKAPFDDAVYGWTVPTDAPFEVNEHQQSFIAESRAIMERLAELHNQAELGNEKAMFIFDGMYDTYSPDNNLVKFFGTEATFSDRSIFDLLSDLSHGTHVAGTVIESSENKAQIHTLSWMAYDAAGAPLPIEDNEKLLESAVEAQSYPDFVQKQKDLLLQEAHRRGRVASDYLRHVGAGVVNMSLGLGRGTGDYLSEALENAYCLANGYDYCETEEWSEEELRVIADLNQDLYYFHSLEFTIPIYENPNVLFVIAAGNEGYDVDGSMIIPAYLSRVFPNVITVAAVDDENEIADFSNVGYKSVNVGAPGVDILSEAVGGIELVKDGTSMAAPHVAGMAAALRTDYPELNARELRRVLEFSGVPSASLADFTSSGTVADLSRARKALIQDSTLSLLVRFREEKIAYNYSQALELMDQILERSPDQVVLWEERAQMCKEQGDLEKAIESLSAALEWEENTDWLRERAYLRAQVGDVTGCFEDYDALEELLPEERPQFQKMRGWSALNFGEFQYAYDAFRRAMALADHHSADLRVGYAISAFLIGHSDEALLIYRRLVDEDPDWKDMEYLNRLGWTKKEMALLFEMLNSDPFSAVTHRSLPTDSDVDSRLSMVKVPASSL